jgi:hypothetical protein
VDNVTWAAFADELEKVAVLPELLVGHKPLFGTRRRPAPKGGSAARMGILLAALATALGASKVGAE